MIERVKRPRSYHSPRRQEQAAATRQAILEAAQRLFEHRGHAETLDASDRGAGRRRAQDRLRCLRDQGRTPACALGGTRLGGDEGDHLGVRARLVPPRPGEPSPERKLRLVAAQARVVEDAPARLLEVIRNAASMDTEIAALWTSIQAKLSEVQHSIVEQLHKQDALAGGLDVDTATDILWTLNHPAQWQLLVRERGWTAQRVRAMAGRHLSAPNCYDKARRSRTNTNWPAG